MRTRATLLSSHPAGRSGVSHISGGKQATMDFASPVRPVQSGPLTHWTVMRLALTSSMSGDRP